MAEVWIHSDAGAIVRADEIAAFTVADGVLHVVLRSGDELPLLNPRPLAGVPALHDGIEVEAMAAAAGARSEAADVVVLGSMIDPGRCGWVFTYLVEVRLVADQRRSELDDRFRAVVRAAVQPGLQQPRRHVPLQDPLRLLRRERLPGRLVLDQFDPVEEAAAADVADDGQVGELVEGRAEGSALPVLAGS